MKWPDPIGGLPCRFLDKGKDYLNWTCTGTHEQCPKDGMDIHMVGSSCNYQGSPDISHIHIDVLKRELKNRGML